MTSAFFRAENRGLTIIWRSEADTKVYEEARTNRLFNTQTPDRYPVAVVFAKTESDIVDTINLAKERECRVSIRAGGHSYASWSVRDEAILLDLGGMEGFTFDDKTNVVTATPNMTGGELIDYLSPKGRVVSVGHCPDVGLGGFLLGGGLGWNVSVCTHQFDFYDLETSNSAKLTLKEFGMVLSTGHSC